MDEDTERGEWWTPPPPELGDPIKPVNFHLVAKSPLPPVVGVTFSLLSGLVTLLGLLLLLIMADFALEPGWWGSEEDRQQMEHVLLALSLFVILTGTLGVLAGILIARRRRIGVYIAWGMCIFASLPTLLTVVTSEIPPDLISLAINASCAFWVGIPLMVSSARIHMA